MIYSEDIIDIYIESCHETMSEIFNNEGKKLSALH